MKHDMTMSQMVARYNEITGENVSKFRDKATALRRLEEAEAAATRVATAATKGRRPYNYPPLKRGVKKCRPSSKRGKLLSMLLKGATFEDCLSLGFGTPQNRGEKTHVNILEIHSWLGYGLRTDGGVITAYVDVT